MSELLRVLADEEIDDGTLQEAAAAAHAILEARGVAVKGVAPVLHERASAAGQQAIDDAVAGDDPRLTLVLSPPHANSRRLRIRPHPDAGVTALLREDEWAGCSWRRQGSEQLDRVEIDGEVYHGDDELVGSEAGP